MVDLWDVKEEVEEALSVFVEGLLQDLFAKYPDLSNIDAEEIIDVVLSEAPEWEWNSELIKR